MWACWADEGEPASIGRVAVIGIAYETCCRTVAVAGLGSGGCRQKTKYAKPSTTEIATEAMMAVPAAAEAPPPPHDGGDHGTLGTSLEGGS